MSCGWRGGKGWVWLGLVYEGCPYFCNLPMHWLWNGKKKTKTKQQIKTKTKNKHRNSGKRELLAEVGKRSADEVADEAPHVLLVVGEVSLLLGPQGHGDCGAVDDVEEFREDLALQTEAWLCSMWCVCFVFRVLFRVVCFFRFVCIIFFRNFSQKKNSFLQNVPGLWKASVSTPSRSCSRLVK